MKIRMPTADDILAVVIPPIYHWRKTGLVLLTAFTLLMLFQASKTHVDAGFEKSLPLNHEYMVTFRKYQEAFGGANTVLVAVIQKEKGTNIYNEQFLGTLKKVTDEVFFLPGIDRARVQSLFTPNTRYIEVVEGGFAGGNVIPADYAPSPEMFDLVKTNVGKAQIIGRFVTNDQRGAMVASELLERDPVTNQRLDYRVVAANLENKIRGQFSSPQIYEYKLTRDVVDPESKEVLIKAGEVIMRDAAQPSRWLRFKTLSADQKTTDGSLIPVKGADVEVSLVDNPNYNPNVDIHIIGFAKVIGDVTDAAGEVLKFFLIAFVMTGILLWLYLGSFKLMLLPLTCSLIAVIWEFGLLYSAGFGLDPFAILVPFLILSVSVSHGVQYVSSWVGEVVDHGRNSYDASLLTFKRLAIPGTTALITDLAGFLTILLIEIAIIREMALNASFGMAAIIITNKWLMPIWLTYMSVKDPEKFRQAQLKREHFGDGLWRVICRVTERGPATVIVLLMALMYGWAMWKSEHIQFGDFKRGVPELRPDSRYNVDSNSIQDNFAIGTDILKVIVETVPEACIKYEVMENIDRFAWRMENTAGVASVVSLPQVAKSINSGWNEGSLKWRILPRNQFVIVQAINPIDTSYGLFNAECSALPVIIFTTDHKSETIEHVVAEVKKYNTENANLEGWRPPADPEQAKTWTAPQPGTPEFDKGPFIDFKLATGNVGVYAATNEVVHANDKPILYWVYAVIFIFVWLSFRTLSGVLCIMLPLALVSYTTYALMSVWEIGLKVATLPVTALAAGIGVDYGLYIYSVMEEKLKEGMSLKEAFYVTLHMTGKAVIFTGIALGGSVVTWLWSDLQFQADMGKLLAFAFSANMVGAIIVLPALAHFVMNKPGTRQQASGLPSTGVLEGTRDMGAKAH
jgi:predicted RND superfamily exporter protein